MPTTISVNQPSTINHQPSTIIIVVVLLVVLLRLRLRLILILIRIIIIIIIIIITILSILSRFTIKVHKTSTNAFH